MGKHLLALITRAATRRGDRSGRARDLVRRAELQLEDADDSIPLELDGGAAGLRVEDPPEHPRAETLAMRGRDGRAAALAPLEPQPRLFASPPTVQEIATVPCPVDSAPYLMALVVSSCRASASDSARPGGSHTASPASRKRSRAACAVHEATTSSPQIGAAPVLLGQDVVGLGQRHQPAGKRASRLRQAGGAAQGLAGDRLDHGKRVLDAVVELVDQQLALFLAALALGDVEADLHGADDAAGSDPGWGGRWTGGCARSRSAGYRRIPRCRSARRAWHG